MSSSLDKDLLKTVLTELRQIKEGLRLASKKLLSVEETAAMMGSSPKTVRNQLSQGTFPVKEVRRGSRVLFKRREVERYIDEL
jgi:excisionase family DNA binding protein